MQSVLLTSIPPVIRGEPLQGAPATSFQRLIIQSWLRAGLVPVSAHTNSELLAHPDHAALLRTLGVEVLTVESSSAEFPQYLPNITSMLRVACEAFPDDVIILTNADIYFDPSFSASDLDALLKLHQGFALSHRTDAASLDHADSGAVCTGGLDVFAARSAHFLESLSFLSPDLTFALPWFDLVMPLALIAAGGQMHWLDPAHFIHVQHHDRWNWRTFHLLGHSSCRFFFRTTRRHPTSDNIAEWCRQYTRSCSLRQPWPVIKSRLKERIDSFQQGKTYVRPYLRDVSSLTLAFLTASSHASGDPAFPSSAVSCTP